MTGEKSGMTWGERGWRGERAKIGGGAIIIHFSLMSARLKDLFD